MTVEEYDFIIVGAGSAGCVLANRLSEDGRHKVLLLEAGGSDRKLSIQVPIGYAFTYQNPSVNWRYNAQPDAGLNNRIAYWPRGRVVGGSSSINAMVYCRGLPHDFDDWAASGATGWNWNSVQPIFERTETKVRRINGRQVVTGKGPLWVTDEADQAHKVTARFLEAGTQAGWPMTDDLNGANPEGLSIYHNTTRNGWRCSSADAFLRPALRRGNLRLVTHATVERLLFEGSKATAVSYRQDDQSRQARARREIIVSGGTINSPKLLQHSGLGPAALLGDHGIDVVCDLPEVGGGLQDHLAISYLYDCTQPTINSQLGRLQGRMAAAFQYAFTRRGLFSLSVNQCGGFIRSSPEAPQPDMQIYCNPVTYSTGVDTPPKVGPEPGFILSFQPSRPTSRGRIDIASPDIQEPPVIKPNSLSSEEDRDGVLRGVHLLRALIETPAMQDLIKARRQPDPTTMNDAEALQDFRERSATVYHPTCTCRMGTGPQNAVLDARLRVHGIEGLRVIDASAFPNVTSGNTNAPTIMLAQKGADMIIEDMQTGGR
tara:strand:+ start:8109 stop:9740 length:1632 start_codon:yes stop_codon:yes gene_type:complete